LIHPEARKELRVLPTADRIAVEHAIEKLIALGDRLGAPHSSAIQGVPETLRELRPRAGRSRWRAFYRRVGEQFVIAAIGPEVSVNPAAFRRATRNALDRLRTLDLDQQ
jgi:phage-related protein